MASRNVLSKTGEKQENQAFEGLEGRENLRTAKRASSCTHGGHARLRVQVVCASYLTTPPVVNAPI